MARRAPAPEEVADRLHSAAIHLLRTVRREDGATGLSPARLSALSVLVFGGPCTVGDLAAAEQVRSPTMSELVADMERQGLVTRRPSASDRRVTVVAATAKGSLLLQAGRRRRVASLAHRLATLDEADLTVLDRAADLVERAVRQRVTPTLGGPLPSAGRAPGTGDPRRASET